MDIEEGEVLQFNKIIGQNFPNLEIQVQEAFRTFSMQNQKRTTPRHIIVKMLSMENKERILKARRKKQQVT
jgi:hypothetical protein